MASSSKSTGTKRAAESGPSTPTKGGAISGPSTPTKDDLRSNGHYETPIKQRLGYDFWKIKKMKSDEPKEPKSLEIASLEAGSIVNDIISFRVTMKSELQDSTYGAILKFHGIDNTGEIAVVAFRSQAEEMNDLVKINHIYKLQTFDVKVENPQYRSSTGHKFQIYLNASSTLVKLEPEDTVEFPPIPFKFIPLDEIQGKPIKSLVDVYGVVVKDWGAAKTASGRMKRDFHITDTSFLNMTVWGSNANLNFPKENCVVAIRNAVVSNYGGQISLNSVNHTTLWIDPDIPENIDLINWFDEQMKL